MSITTAFKGLRNDISKFIARRLSDKDSLESDKYTPKSWFHRAAIVPNDQLPPASGLGLVQSPYISQWTKMWGIQPIADLSKYRMMYNTVPIIKKAVDKTVATAISKGFSLDLPDTVENRNEILAYVKEWIAKQEDFHTNMSMLASDALVYGSSYAEIVYDEVDVSEKNAPALEHYTIPDPSEVVKMGENNVPFIQNMDVNNPGGLYYDVKAKGSAVWLKPLDPLWIRVRRDSFGNIFGFLQYLSTPPVAFTSENIIHIKFNPKTDWTNNAYGYSMLRSLIRTQEAIWQIENDMILISHACSKPPVIFSCGTEDEPWGEGDLTTFVAETTARGPGGDIYHRGDVKTTPLPFPASSLAPLLAHLDYHAEQRMVAMGVPPDLLGVHASSNRSVATVSMDDWINTIQQLQEQIADAFEEQLFRLIVEKQFGEGTPVPRLVWNQIYEKDQTIEMNKIIAAVNTGLITKNEGRAWMEELGKKLTPMTGGDSLQPIGPGQSQNETPIDTEEQSKYKDEEISASQMSAYYDPSYLYTPEEEELLVDKIIQEHSASEFSEPGIGNIGAPQNQLMYPVLSMPLKKKFESNIDDIRIKELTRHDDVIVYLVSGDAVSKKYDPEWKNTIAETNHDYIGGHSYVFAYIPENEIWISDLLEDKEGTIIHEFVERHLMKEDSISYENAHKEALKAEGLTDDEILTKEYISPEKVVAFLNESYLKHPTQDNVWKVGKKIITFDPSQGVLYISQGQKNIDKMLIRNESDLDKFSNKHKADKVEEEVDVLKSNVEEKYKAVENVVEAKYKEAIQKHIETEKQLNATNQIMTGMQTTLNSMQAKLDSQTATDNIVAAKKLELINKMLK